MSNLITLQIEGTPSEDGHVLVSDFIGRLEELLATLNGIDRIVGQTAQPTLNYRIVDASHKSPLTLTIEPIIKSRVKPEPQHIQKRNARFFKEMRAVRRNEPISPEIDDAVLDHMRAMVEGLGTEFISARIYNGESDVDLDSTFEKNVRRLLEEEDASYGSEEGMLEAGNIHGRARTCWIYPRIGAQRIRCDFLPGTRDQIKDNFGKYVRVEGVKYFRPTSPFPFRVAVKDFQAIEDEQPISLKDIEGIAPNATGGISSVEFVRNLRDEWDQS
jgi:hypothetical protein